MKNLIILILVLITLLIVSCEPKENSLTTEPTIGNERSFNNLPKTNEEWITLAKLNPTSDVNGSCYIPYTSGGFNMPAIWNHHTIDLSEYQNMKVLIRFYFNTGDGLYNNHEGWFIDNLQFAKAMDNIDPNSRKNKIWKVEGSNLENGPRWHITNRKSKSADYSWVYQNPATFNFQGANVSSECSDESNWGALVLSRPVLLKRSGPLEFDTLWEIESVDAPSFDLMQVQITIIE